MEYFWPVLLFDLMCFDTQKPGRCVRFSSTSCVFFCFFFSSCDGQSAFSCSFRWHFKVGGPVCAHSLTFRVMDVTVDPWDWIPCLCGSAADGIVSFWAAACARPVCARWWNNRGHGVCRQGSFGAAVDKLDRWASKLTFILITRKTLKPVAS